MTQNSLLIPVKDTPKTARMIAEVLVPQWSGQVLSIVEQVRDKDSKKTFKKLWHYCRDTYQYHEDPNGFELIRSPQESYKARKTGIDCEDFAIIITGVLLNLGYSPSLRIVDFGNGWQHIYVVCLGVVIDPVNEGFNKEEKYLKKMDFVVKRRANQGLSGITTRKYEATGLRILEKGFVEWLILKLKEEKAFVQGLIKRYPKSNWSSRPLNYKVYPKEDDALELTLLLFNEAIESLSSKGGISEELIDDLFNERLKLGSSRDFDYFGEQYVKEMQKLSPDGSNDFSEIKRSEFVIDMQIRLEKKEKLDRRTVEKVAQKYGITNNSEVKELTEYAIVKVCRQITAQSTLTYEEIYAQLVDFYKSQPNLSLRTSNSILLQQYSTPSPIAYLMGIYCGIDKPKVTLFEPSAGNGLLTIASRDLNQVVVNEIDTLRLANLEKQGFHRVTAIDGSKNFDFDYNKGYFYKGLSFDAIITNPPFGALDVMNRQSFGGYDLKDLDYVMAANALRKMKKDGKAAIIIGGHTNYDELGRVQAGKNRVFLNYLYSHYNVDDVILINGDLFSRQGTSFDIRLILINGRKETPEGVAPLKTKELATVEKTFADLYERVMYYVVDNAVKNNKMANPNLYEKGDKVSFFVSKNNAISGKITSVIYSSGKPKYLIFPENGIMDLEIKESDIIRKHIVEDFKFNIGDKVYSLEDPKNKGVVESRRNISNGSAVYVVRTSSGKTEKFFNEDLGFEKSSNNVKIAQAKLKLAKARLNLALL